MSTFATFQPIYAVHGIAAVSVDAVNKKPLIRSANMLDHFPDKPKGMHWRTYIRLRHSHYVAAARSTIGLLQFVDRLSRPSSLRREQ